MYLSTYSIFDRLRTVNVYLSFHQEIWSPHNRNLLFSYSLATCCQVYGWQLWNVANLLLCELRSCFACSLLSSHSLSEICSYNSPNDCLSKWSYNAQCMLWSGNVKTLSEFHLVCLIKVVGCFSNLRGSHSWAKTNFRLTLVISIYSRMNEWNA